MVFGFGWTKNFTLAKVPSLVGKVAIVTGSNSGVGKATAQHLAANGAKVILACRNQKKADQAAQEIRQAIQSKPNPAGQRSAGSVETGKLDLSDLGSVEQFAQDFLAKNEKLDILICNAGIVPSQFTLAAKPKHELTFVTNHLGHFYLVEKLLPIMQKTASSPDADTRIVVVAADMTNWIDWTRLNGGKEWLLGLESHIDDPKQFNGPRAYLRTKIMNILFTRRLATLIEEQHKNKPEIGRVRVNCLHPGVVSSQIFTASSHDPSGKDLSFGEKAMSKVLNMAEGTVVMSGDDGALTSLYAATSPEVVQKDYHGEYFFPYGVPKQPAPICLDEQAGLQLWQKSIQLCRIANPGQSSDGSKACANFDQLEREAQPTKS